MKAWVDYLNSRTKDGIVDYSYYGDWCPPREFLVHPDSGVSKYTPGLLISTGYLYYCAVMLSQIADRRIEKPEDVLSEGQIVDAKITAVDEEKKKISLSIRALLAPTVEEAAEEAPVEE